MNKWFGQIKSNMYNIKLVNKILRIYSSKANLEFTTMYNVVGIFIFQFAYIKEKKSNAMNHHINFHHKKQIKKVDWPIEIHYVHQCAI